YLYGLAGARDVDRLHQLGVEIGMTPFGGRVDLGHLAGLAGSAWQLSGATGTRTEHVTRLRLLHRLALAGGGTGLDRLGALILRVRHRPATDPADLPARVRRVELTRWARPGTAPLTVADVVAMRRLVGLAGTEDRERLTALARSILGLGATVVPTADEWARYWATVLATAGSLDGELTVARLRGAIHADAVPDLDATVGADLR